MSPLNIEPIEDPSNMADWPLQPSSFLLGILWVKLIAFSRLLTTVGLVRSVRTVRVVVAPQCLRQTLPSLQATAEVFLAGNIVCNRPTTDDQPCQLITTAKSTIKIYIHGHRPIMFFRYILQLTRSTA